VDDHRGKALQGNVRKVARLLKELKYDADTEVAISSYDITAIAYRMPNELMRPAHGAEPLLVENVHTFLQTLLNDANYRASLKVPNEMRAIFCVDGVSLQGLIQLHREVKELLDEIRKEFARSLRKLEDARISY